MFTLKTKSNNQESQATSASIIGAGTTITGNIESNGDIRVDGTIKGNIYSTGNVICKNHPPIVNGFKCSG